MDLFITTSIGLAITLGLASLGGLFSEKSGIINIGIEGMMTSGALMWALSGTIFKNMGQNGQIMSFILAGAMGSAIALLHAFVSITLRGNQIISGTAINMLSAGISLYVINAFKIGERPGQIVSGYQILGFKSEGIWSQISVLFIVVLLIFGFAWWVLKHSIWGLKLRTVGENPVAAEAVGINVIKIRYQALIVSGFLAGMAGGFFVQYLSGTFYGGVQGYGFLALGILIFGQWKVHYVGIATIIFSTLTVFALIGQTQFSIDWLNKVPSDFLKTIPFISSIGIMIITAKSMSNPQALGKPYKRTRS